LAGIESIRSSFDAKNLADPDFWSVIGQTELELYMALAAGKLAPARKSLTRGYKICTDVLGRRRCSRRRMTPPSSYYESTRRVLPKKERKAAEDILA